MDIRKSNAYIVALCRVPGRPGKICQKQIAEGVTFQVSTLV